MSPRLLFTLAAITFLSACRIEIATPTSGAVVTASDAIVCDPGAVCTIDVVDIFFSETFLAEPEEGFEFTGWERFHRAFCGGSSEPCHLETSGFAAIAGLLAFLENPDETFFLQPTFKSTGFSGLFMGHSFFRPFAEGLEEHALRAGIEDHLGEIFFSGGSSGAPEALWDNAQKREAIQSLLDAAEIELFAMTYHPDYPGLRGYRLWIDYALAQNPETRIAIALPWPTQPELTEAQAYAAAWHEFHEGEFHAGIDALRALYPDTEIFCIPYGQSAIELRLLLEAGKLEDVSALTSGTEDAIFRDALGHAQDILVDLGELVWLQAVYGIDLESYGHDPGYIADLKAIALGILEGHDPAYDAPYR